GLESLIKKHSSKEKPVFEDVKKAEELIKQSQAKIAFAPIDKACYLPEEDKILMPQKEQFKTGEGFYSTMFHELSHWTAHKTRLNRPIKNSRASKAYAFEELIAEISASFICCHLGFEYSTQHSSYVKSWLEVLKEDKRSIFKASSKAQKATEFILGKLNKESS
ncbi:MAG: zincin-like metallopeptidase domain-containing protein, partial [Oligoflexia bacterium]|nr:zincin-like metallopeptidase domain-containing protein [Oligoflexia bacterium]